MDYPAPGADHPPFPHAPSILGAVGNRLTTRHGATAIGEYREQGILPEAMANFLALIGWSPGGNEEVFTIEELIERFSLDGINKKSGVFDPKKLEWMNGQHLSRTPAIELEPELTAKIVAAGLASSDALAARRDWYLALIDLLKTRARNLDELARHARAYLVEEIEYEEEAVRKHWKDPALVREQLGALRQRFAAAQPWDEATLEATLRTLADELGVGAGKLIHPLRVSLTGFAVSPGIFEVLVAMGPELALRRLDAALTALQSQG
jgi:glutamyl-tRNA synthetase